MTSKAIWAILAVIIFLVVVGSGWSSWSVALVASIGGIVVFLGLWIEKEAEWDKKKHLSNLVKKWIELKLCIGWWILMTGITVEIVTAVGLAVHDSGQNKQNDKKIAAIYPIAVGFGAMLLKPCFIFFLMASRIRLCLPA